MLWLIGLTLLQVFVLNRMEYTDLVIPFAYVFFLLFLPRNLNRALVLILAFTSGFIIDIFSNSYGVHAFATTFIAFVRPFLLTSLAPSDMGSESIRPSVYTMGWNSYLIYAFICVFLHHLLVFYVEIFEWNQFLRTLLRSIFSTIVSLFVISVLQVVFIREKK